MGSKLKEYTDVDGGLIFGSRVNDPEKYGVVEFDQDLKVKSIVEKPEHPKSKYTVRASTF